MQSGTVILLYAILFLLPLSLWSQSGIIDGDTLVTFTVIENIHSGSDVFEHETISLTEVSAGSDLSDILTESTSIYIKDGGPGVQASSGYRGGSAQQQVLLWNGMMINSSSLGYTDLNTLPTFLFDEIELSNGPGSLIKGDGVLGAALDLRSNAKVSREGLELKFRSIPTLEQVTSSALYDAKVGKGSMRIGAYRGSAENQYSFLNYTLFEPAISKQSHAAQESWGLRSDFLIPGKKNGTYQFSFQHSFLFREVPAVLGTVLRGEELEDNQSRLMFIMNKDFLGFRSEFPLGFAHDDQYYSDSLSQIFSRIDGKIFHSRIVLSKSLAKWGSLRLKLSTDQNEVSTQNYSMTRKRSVIGTYIDWEKSWKNLSSNISARQAWVDGESIPNTGALGIKYERRSYVIRGSIGRTYRIPTFNDLYWTPGGNEDLIPEQGWSAQISTVAFIGKSSLGFCFFRNKYQNMIVWIPTQSGYWSPLNRSQLDNEGVEINGSMNVHAHWSMNAAWTFSRVTSWKEGTVDYIALNRQPLYVPRTTGTASIKYNDGKNSFTYTQRYNGEVFTDNTNQYVVEASFPVKLNYTRTVTSAHTKFDIGITVNNLLNQDYELVRGRPLPRRLLQLDAVIYLNLKKK